MHKMQLQIDNTKKCFAQSHAAISLNQLIRAMIKHV